MGSQPTSSPTDAPTVLPTIDPIKRMVSIVSVDLPTKCMQPEQLKDGAGVELRKCITDENFRLIQGWIFENGQIRFSSSAFKNRCILVQSDNSNIFSGELIIGPCGSPSNEESLFKYYPQEKHLRWVKDKSLYVTNVGTDLVLQEKNPDTGYRGQQWVFFRGAAQPTPSNIFNPNVSPAIAPVVQPVKVPTVSPTKLPTSQPTSSPTGAPTVLPTIDPIKRMVSIVSVDLPTKCMQPEQLKDGAGVELRKCITDENFKDLQGWTFENGQIMHSSTTLKNMCILAKIDKTDTLEGELVFGPCGSPSNEMALFKYDNAERHLRWKKDKKLFVTNVGENIYLKRRNSETDYK